jgi:hypothetical protein
MMHGHDRPSGFDSVTEESNKRWQKRNSALLADQDPVTAQISNVILLSSLGGVCTELAISRTDARAQLVIERATRLWTAMVECSHADAVSG